MIESFILWIVFGGIAGWVASAITGTNQSLLGDIIVGILGAILGGWLFSTLGARSITGFDLPSMLVAIVGSIILLWIVHAFRGDATIRT